MVFKERVTQIETNVLFNSDCLLGMQTLPAESVDLVVTDPPYLMDYQSNRRVVKDRFKKILNDKDSHSLISEALAQYHRVLKNNTAIYMFCSWHHIDFFKQEFEKWFTLKNILIWNKNNHGSGDLKGSYAPKYECVLFGHKGRALLKDKRVPDVIDCAKIDSSKLTHPTEKPIELLKIFIQNNSEVGDVVLDGFAGTGSTLLASIELGRKYIGFELDSNYSNIAKTRLNQYIIDHNLQDAYKLTA
jgi:site-specific DNA-methyltransferase (adenine-specific)